MTVAWTVDEKADLMVVGRAGQKAEQKADEMAGWKVAAMAD